MGPAIRSFIASSIIAVTLAVLSSCFGSSLFAPGTPVDFCIAQAQAYCDLQYRCCTAAERNDNPFGLFQGPSVARLAPATQQECVGVVTEICRGSAEQQNESFTEERIKYDPDEAQSCLDDLHKAVDECNAADFFDADGTYIQNLVQAGQPGVLGSACDNAIEGDVDDGDDCFASYECKKGGCVIEPTANTVSSQGNCAGEGHPENPFNTGFQFDMCNGFADEEKAKQ